MTKGFNRDFPSVVGDILGSIPKDQGTLIKSLTSLRHSAGFAAPEVRSVLWKELEEILEAEIGPPSLKWHWDIVEIVTGKDMRPKR